jgi:ABC transport system ATP-binding/permease protein
MPDGQPRPATTILIGREPDNDIALASDLEVSRHHAVLRRHADDSVELIDLGSANGAYVSGQRITPAMLTEQDTIDIGHTRFQLADGELRPCAD